MKKLIVRESDVSSLTISPMVTTPKKTHVHFQVNSLYVDEDRPRISGTWVSRKDAKKIVKALNEFLNQ